MAAKPESTLLCQGRPTSLRCWQPVSVRGVEIQIGVYRVGPFAETW